MSEPYKTVQLRVIEALSSSLEPVAAEDIARLTGMKQSNVSAQLSLLFQGGEVKRAVDRTSIRPRYLYILKNRDLPGYELDAYSPGKRLLGIAAKASTAVPAVTDNDIRIVIPVGDGQVSMSYLEARSVQKRLNALFGNGGVASSAK